MKLLSGVLVLLFAAGFNATSQGAVSNGHPNVVIVLVDDQGYGDLSCTGHPIIKTPNIDKLYSESLRLTDFHATPVCSPSRSELLSGLNNVRAGVWSTVRGRSILRRDCPTIADIFAANGYHTCQSGKWHLGDNYPYRPMDRGFQDCLFNGGGGVGQTPDFWGNKYIDDTYSHNGVPEKEHGYCTDVWFDHALHFIEANKDQPFLCYIPTNVVHEPIIPPPGYEKLYPKQPPALAHYFRELANLDDNIGKLRKKLADLGLADNTILIYSSDNGATPRYAGVYNAGMRGTKGTYYEGGHREPGFIYWPAGGFTGGRDIGQLSSFTDVLPTLIDLCSLKLPHEVKFDGVDLSPVLKGTVNELPERIVIEQLHQMRVEPPTKGDAAILSPGWRLVRKELFDIKADPGQKKDVAAAHPDVVAHLRDLYDQWWNSVSAEFGDRSPLVLGDDHANPTRLTAHDWSGQPVWNQDMIRSGMRANGDWAVEVAKAGQYTITLQRWPKEADAPIAGAPNGGGESIPVAGARLKVADFDQSQPVPADARGSAFTVKLPAGRTTLQTWFLDSKQKELCGAYYIYVERTGD
jgi:arylsulfatase B